MSERADLELRHRLIAAVLKKAIIPQGQRPGWRFSLVDVDESDPADLSDPINVRFVS